MWRSNFSGSKKERASRASFRKFSKNEPWYLFAPERSTMFITPPAMRPYSAENPLVSILNSCIASRLGRNCALAPRALRSLNPST